MWKLETLYSFENCDVIVADGMIFIHNKVYENLPDNLMNKHMIYMLEKKYLKLALKLANDYNKGVLL